MNALTKSDEMRFIVYLWDGSITESVCADTHVASGIARYATPDEITQYLRWADNCDASMKQE